MEGGYGIRVEGEEQELGEIEGWGQEGCRTAEHLVT
jgi:hypothetical protein